MRTEIFNFEAEQCRRQAATAFEYRPEKTFLLRLAEMFDELAREATQLEPASLKAEAVATPPPR